MIEQCYPSNIGNRLALSYDNLCLTIYVKEKDYSIKKYLFFLLLGIKFVTPKFTSST